MSIGKQVANLFKSNKKYAEIEQFPPKITQLQQYIFFDKKNSQHFDTFYPRNQNFIQLLVEWLQVFEPLPLSLNLDSGCS